jgi:CHAT domain-containing protein/tetratricopeptide (TPR) repeat protein
MFVPTAWRAVLLAALVLTPIPFAARTRSRVAPRNFPSGVPSPQNGIGAQDNLKVGPALQRHIAGGLTQYFAISLLSGQYMAVELEQKGAVLLATLRDPDGKEVIQMDSPSGGFGPIRLSAIAITSGEYHLEVLSVNKWAIRKEYEVSITALRSAAASDESEIAAMSAFANGRKSFQVNKLREAIGSYKQALAYWESQHEYHWQALTQYAISEASLSLDRKQFEDYLNETLSTLAAHMSPDDWRLKASALNDLGYLYSSSGRGPKALELLNEALNLYAEHKDLRGQASALNNLAQLENRKGNVSRAIELIQQALIFREAENDIPRRLNLLGGLAALTDAQGEPEQALNYLEKQLKAWREIPDNELKPDDQVKVAALLNNLAAENDKLGNWDEAQSYYAQALAKFQANNPQRAATLDNQGELYVAMGNLLAAEACYQQATDVLEKAKLPDVNVKAGLLVHTGQLSIVKRDVEAALRFFDEALRLSPTGTKRVDVLTNQGMAFAKQGNFEKAQAAFEAAWKAQAELNTVDLRRQALILQERGEALANSGKLAEGLIDLKEALKLWRSVRDPRSETATLKNIAEAESAQGNLTAALRHNEEGISLIESLRSNISNRQLRTSYFANQATHYELDVDLKMRISQVDKNSDYTAAALESNEKARARVLLDVLADAGVRKDCSGNYEVRLAQLINQRCSLQKRLTAKANLLTQLLSGPHSDEQIATLDREIGEIAEQHGALEAQIRLQSRSFASLIKPQPVSSKQIQAELDDETLLLEYSLQDRRSYVWAVTPEWIRGFELSGRAEIEGATRRFLAALTARNVENKGETPTQRNARLIQADQALAETGATLSKLIMSPVVSWLGQKRLVIVADGLLQTIPFAALPAPADLSAEKYDATGALANPRYLVDDHEIINIPSASVLAVQRQELETRKPATHAVAVVANPVYNTDDLRVRRVSRSTPRSAGVVSQARSQAAASAKESNDSAAPELQRALRDVGVGQLSWLPHSLDEARAILKVAPPGDSFLALDFKASRATAMSPRLSQYRIVHFATHGIVDSQRPELSGLVLSTVEENGRPQDGYLRLHDIYNLNLPTELAVLSACETGVGQQVKGEGLIALTRGFMYAGARRVVASLWKVNDAATAELMAQFYKEMFVDGLKPAAALRSAQMSISHHKPWQAPYYWAGFVLQGEWR